MNEANHRYSDGWERACAYLQCLYQLYPWATQERLCYPPGCGHTPHQHRMNSHLRKGTPFELCPFLNMESSLLSYDNPLLSIILYQAFSVEVIVWFPSGYWTMTIDTGRKKQQGKEDLKCACVHAGFSCEIERSGKPSLRRG